VQLRLIPRVLQSNEPVDIRIRIVRWTLAMSDHVAEADQANNKNSFHAIPFSETTFFFLSIKQEPV
jgi:hypothetical protein